PTARVDPPEEGADEHWPGVYTGWASTPGPGAADGGPPGRMAREISLPSGCSAGRVSCIAHPVRPNYFKYRDLQPSYDLSDQKNVERNPTQAPWCAGSSWR